MKKQVNETLYGKTKTGKIKEWSVYVEGDQVIVEYGQKDGKLQQQMTTCKPKNVGKSNETTAQEQAISEALSKWTKQKERKLYRESVEELENLRDENPYPMLAKDALKVPHMIKYPCTTQPKLNGLRVMVEYNRDLDTVRAISRTGKIVELHIALITDLQQLMRDLNIQYLDGELYHPDLLLQEINSASKTKTHEYHHKLELHVFDIPSDKQWLSVDDSRFIDLKTLGNNLEGVDSFVKVVNNYGCCNEVEMQEQLEGVIEQGYEGLIIRNFDGVYEWNHRSSDLLKLKTFEDGEAKVIGCVEDKMFEGVLECEWVNTDGKKVQFECKMKGDHDYRNYNNMLKMIGKWINFSYQDLTKDGKPSFPVGQYERACDDDGNPLE